MPSSPQPRRRDNCCVSQKVSEPAPETLTVWPLISSTVLNGPSLSTVSMMMFGAPENTATAFIGAPLTMAENDGLPPSAMSSELAVSACTILASPRKGADVEIDAVLLENAGFDADVGRDEGELIGLRLAQPQRRLGGRRVGQDQAGERRGGACAGKPHNPRHREHRHPPLAHLAGKKASV